MESSTFETVLELATKQIPPRVVNPLLPSCDAMLPHDAPYHFLGKHRCQTGSFSQMDQPQEGWGGEELKEW